MALMAAHPLADRDEFKRLTPPCTDLECVDECDHTTAHCGRMDDVATRWNAANAHSTSVAPAASEQKEDQG